MFITRALDDRNFGLSKEILKKAIGGDNEATKLVLNKVLPYLRGTASRTNLYNTPREDLYQYLYDEFTEWFFEKEGRKTYDPDRGNFKPWLLSIISTSKIDYIKFIDRKQPVSYDTLTDEEISLVDIIPQLKVEPEFKEISEMHDVIERSKKDLEPREQKILDMMLEGGYTQEEIGAEVNLGVGGVSAVIINKIRPVVKKYLQT